ncbi:MAG: malonic semialdehyde reductase [Propionivibrio sp.]
MMINDPSVLEQVFTGARTFNTFTDRPVSDATLRELYDLLRWGPTSMNSQPGRYVFLRSKESRQRLIPALSPGNQAKTLAAPVTIIVAQDTRFFENLPTQFPAYDARPTFEANAVLAESTAFRNSTLQGAYLIIAARILGLDCGPMSGFDPAKVNAEFFPDGRWKANFLVNLGYGDPSGNYPRGPRLPFDSVAQLL